MGTNPKYGTDTLAVIASAYNFNHWMYKQIAKHCSGSILEIGSGIGNISKYFINDGASITLSDFDKSYLPGLIEEFGNNKNLNGVYHLDFSDKNIEKNHPDLLQKFDTIFALNVVEHIPEHDLALKNACKLLRENGKIVILVPAFQRLFNQFDVQLEHQRRYTKKTLKKLIEANGFKLQYSAYFNFIGILGWFISGKILNKKIIPGGQMKLYDSLVPFWKIIDYFTKNFAGLSVIQVGKKVKQ
jgi:SAM-dependent methyltransferase